jgi:Ca-activated chloride channel family protein
MMMFRFAYPIVLLLFVAVLGWLVYSVRRRRPSITYSMTSAMATLVGSGKGLRDKIPLALRTGCLVLLVLTAARPQFYNVSKEVRSPGVDIMLCLDTSGSMEALDFKLNDEPVSRLTAVKKVVSEFITKREMDRIGLVVFGEEAFTQSPLTVDKGLLLGLVKNMKIGMAGDRTAIGSAIAVAGKRLKDLKAKSRILILLTDGRQNAGDITPEEASEAVRAFDVKIYTIGVGGKGPAPFKVRTFLGPRLVYQDVDLDEATLKKVASIGGGKYFRAADSKQLSEIYDIIDREEKTEIKVKEFFHFRELYYYTLVPGLFLLGLEIFIKNTLLRVVP